MSAFKTVKGFRDLFPEDCARREYFLQVWRTVARRYAFVEYEAPILESTDLYRKKSGDEIVGQLFCFTDKKGREIALRPEVTPSLARMAAAKQRHFTKPMKWFQIGSCFRYEEPQRGRTREFIQFNADILGEKNVAADAELIAMAIDTMRPLGFSAQDITVRLSDRRVWHDFLAQQGADAEKTGDFLQIIDKLERLPEPVIEEKLAAIGLSLAQVREFMTSSAAPGGELGEVVANLVARGLGSYIKVDYGIVRGLAYYTGVVFEVFDNNHGLRAIAGGGRYDQLCAQLTDGSTDLPAAGFAMGDVVLGELMKLVPKAALQFTNYLSRHFALDLYVVVADENHRAEALTLIQELREEGYDVEYSLTPAKVGKQFQAAEQLQCHMVVLVDKEYPRLQIKNLATRHQTTVSRLDLEEALAEELAEESGIFIAASDLQDEAESEQKILLAAR